MSSDEYIMNWISPKPASSTQGILIDSILWPSSGDIGAIIEFDMKLNQSSHTENISIISDALTNEGIYVFTHDLPINDGPLSVNILNNGTTNNGTINGTENTDYEWQVSEE